MLVKGATDGYVFHVMERQTGFSNRFIFLLLGFGLASRSVDGPGADQDECGLTDPETLTYSIYQHSSGRGVFLVDDSTSAPMYDDVETLGNKYEFRIWMRSERNDVHNFRVEISTYGDAVSCTAPQTLVYMAAEPTSVGCCGNQTQCKPIGGIKERSRGLVKTCTYDCECLDALCKCSHLVIRFYYVLWFGESQLDGYLYSLVAV